MKLLALIAIYVSLHGSEDKEWIDETGKTSDVSATKWLNAGIERKGEWYEMSMSPDKTYTINYVAKK